MVKAAGSSAIDLRDFAERKNAEAEARRREKINDPDEAVFVVERGQRRMRHPEIHKLDTMAILAAEAQRTQREKQRGTKKKEDEYPLLRAFGYGFSFMAFLLMLAEILVWVFGW